MTKEQRTAMARVTSDMIKADNIIEESEINDMEKLMSGYAIPCMTRSELYTPRQHCSGNCTILLSLHGNVAILMNDANIFLIFAAKNL
jgi:hypothetical protein